MQRDEVNRQLVDIECTKQQIYKKQEQIKCLENLLQSNQQELEILSTRLFHLDSNYAFYYQSMLAYESKISKINIIDLPTDVLNIIHELLPRQDRSAFACCTKLARVRFAQVRTMFIINADYEGHGRHVLTNCMEIINCVHKWNSPTYIAKMGNYVTKYAPRVVFSTNIINIKQLLTVARLSRIRLRLTADEVMIMLEYIKKPYKNPHSGFVELHVPNGTVLPKNSDKTWRATIKYY